MSPKEFRETMLSLIEKGIVFAFQYRAGGELVFHDKSSSPLGIPVSFEEVRLMFQEDEEREKAEMN